MTTYYCGAKIFDNGNLLSGFALVIEKQNVCAIIPESAIPSHASITTLNDGILSPGFVETQANGGAGILVNDGYDHDSLAKIIQGHRQFGTVAMLPTFITDSQEKYHAAIESIALAVKKGLPGLIGGHFEGPFINLEKKGTHNPTYIRLPDEKDFFYYEKYAPYLKNSIISIAPECLPKGTIARIKNSIPQINMAHSMATHQDLEQAYSEGLTGITHLYNAMRPMQGRDPGPIGSAAELGLYCGIIVDGIHSHPYALAHAYRSIGASHLLLVTDSMHTIGAPDIKEFMLMDIKVFVENDRLVNEQGSLAGAHITLLQSLQNAVRYMHADIRDALCMAISTPAYYVNRPDLASIVNRHCDDIIYLDNTLSLQTWQQ